MDSVKSPGSPPEDLLAGDDFVHPVRRLAADGLEAWSQVIERGYEGYVAKDEASAYEGGRTTRWLELKQKGWTVEDDGWRRRISTSDREPAARDSMRGVSRARSLDS